MMLFDARRTDHQRHSAKVSGAPCGDGRARSSPVGGGGGPRIGLGGHHCGSACHWFVPHHDQRRSAGVGFARSTASGGIRSSAATGRRTEAPAETDPGLMAALPTSGFVDVLIEPATRGDPESPLRWTCKSTRRLADELTRSHHPVSANTVASLLRQAGYSLQANRFGAGRRLASRPQRSISTHQYFDAIFPRSWSAGDLGRRQKEGVDRRFQERRLRVAPSWPTGGSSCPRLHRQRTGESNSLWCLRNAQQRGLGKRRSRPRHRSVRRSQHSHLVEKDGPSPISPCQAVVDYRRRRREQSRRAGTARACGRCRCRSWRTSCVSSWWSAIFRRAPASGTRSSIASSVSLPRTGVAGP